MELEKYMKQPVTRRLLELLWAHDKEMKGFDLCEGVREDNPTWPYATIKSSLQALRNDGVVVVTANGPAGKAKWVAYQMLWFSPWAEGQMAKLAEADDEQFNRRVEQAKEMVRNGRRSKLTTKFMDDREKMAVLQLGVALGLVRVVVEADPAGKDRL